jgi:hypothetical protein
MNGSAHFQIHYWLRGEKRRFYLYSEGMTNARAWHMAAVDAGFADIPKYRSDRVAEVCKPKAERFGITEVSWGQA